MSGVASFSDRLFHDRNLLFGQAVEGVDYLVDEVVGLFQSIGDLAILASIAAVDLQEIGQVGHRAYQFAQEVLKGGFRPGQRLGEVVKVDNSGAGQGSGPRFGRLLTRVYPAVIPAATWTRPQLLS